MSFPDILFTVVVLVSIVGIVLATSLVIKIYSKEGARG